MTNAGKKNLLKSLPIKNNMNTQLIHDLEHNKTPVQKTVRRLKRKVDRGFKTPLTVTVCILFGMFIAGYLFYKATNYTNNHKFIWHAPVEIKFFTPLKIEEVKKGSDTREIIHTPVKSPKNKIFTSPTVTPHPKTEKEIIFSMKHGEVLWKVYGMESTWGKNDYCRINGLGYAGFGVMDNGNIVCYTTFEKATARAEYWITKLGVDEDLATALCTWNTGVRQPNCVYYQQYLML